MSNYQLSKPEKGRQTSRKVRTKTGGERRRQRDRQRETNRNRFSTHSGSFGNHCNEPLSCGFP